MSREELFKEIKTLIMQNFDLPEEEIVPEAKFGPDLGIDSLDFTDLTISIENLFGVSAYSPEYDKLANTHENDATVQDLVDVVGENLGI